MAEDHVYLQIANSIRRDIENGMYKAGDTLPSLRKLTETWHCTIGTAQRAIQTLVSEGLVSSHVGKGTKVLGPISFKPLDSLRRANLINRTESFLLEVLTAGYELAEIEESFRIAIERWHAISQPQDSTNQGILRLSGSHDLAVAWLATRFDEISPGYKLLLNFSGSMAGLMSLAEGKANIAASHLWDDASEAYNTPFLHSLFPGEKLAMITLAHRRIGFLVKPGNPKKFYGVNDLTRTDLQFINRNAGSGTRVYLDSLLKKNNIQPGSIRGYLNPKNTHSEVAVEVAEGHADVGIGLEAAARAYDLDFLFLTLERYDLIIKPDQFTQKPIQDLIVWLKGEDFQALLNRLGGYDGRESGEVRWS